MSLCLPLFHPQRTACDRFKKKKIGQVKYNTIYAFGENNESGIWGRHVPVWRGLISIVLSVINSGLNNYYSIDRILVCTGSGMYRLHCIYFFLCQQGGISPLWCIVEGGGGVGSGPPLAETLYVD